LPHESLEAFIQEADKVGEVAYVTGADRDEDVGVLTELVAESKGPMVVFDEFEGYPKGHRVAINPIRTPRRFAVAHDLPVDRHPLELLGLWREKRRNISTPMPPRVVTDGPVFGVTLKGDDVDLDAFPAPRWHDGDGGRYIGTADMVVLRDPDAGWVNIGVYRGMIQGRDRLSLWILNSKHGRIILERYWSRGEAAPVAVVLGCEPVTWMTAGMAPPFGTSEYDLAGALRGEPVSVVELPDSKLPVPATSEIVLEGVIPPIDEESAHEGPFGEWPGYYSHEGDEPVVRVNTIYRAENPILLGTPPLRPLGASDSVAIPAFTIELWDHLDRSGVTDVTGVWGFSKTLMIVISLRQRYAGHAKQALLAAAGYRSNASMYTYYVVVDDDIDVTNLEEVMWAMCTRVDPATSVDIVRGAWTTGLDPRLTPEKKETGDMTMGRMLVDATRPFAWKDSFPATNIYSRERRRAAVAKWSDTLQGIRDMS
jgi:UbiD family decarboxylase